MFSFVFSFNILVYCEFFQIHCSKFKPDPILYCCQASVWSISHCVLFFCIRNYSLNFFFSFLVQFFVLGCITSVLCKLYVFLPDVSGYCFLTPLILCKALLSDNSCISSDCFCTLCSRHGLLLNTLVPDIPDRLCNRNVHHTHTSTIRVPLTSSLVFCMLFLYTDVSRMSNKLSIESIKIPLKASAGKVW